VHESEELLLSLYIIIGIFMRHNYIKVYVYTGMKDSKGQAVDLQCVTYS